MVALLSVLVVEIVLPAATIYRRMIDKSNNNTARRRVGPQRCFSESEEVKHARHTSRWRFLLITAVVGWPTLLHGQVSAQLQPLSLFVVVKRRKISLGNTLHWLGLQSRGPSLSSSSSSSFVSSCALSPTVLHAAVSPIEASPTKRSPTPMNVIIQSLESPQDVEQLLKQTESSSPFNAYSSSSSSSSLTKPASKGEEDEFVLIKFYAKWCKSCAKFGLLYEKLAREHYQQQQRRMQQQRHQPQEYVRPRITFAQMEYTAQPAYCRSLGISRVPTVQLYRRRDGLLLHSLSCPPSQFGRVRELLDHCCCCLDRSYQKHSAGAHGTITSNQVTDQELDQAPFETVPSLVPQSLLSFSSSSSFSFGIGDRTDAISSTSNMSWDELQTHAKELTSSAIGQNRPRRMRWWDPRRWTRVRP